jgi:hypothetical protein
MIGRGHHAALVIVVPSRRVCRRQIRENSRRTECRRTKDDRQRYEDSAIQDHVKLSVPIKAYGTARMPEIDEIRRQRILCILCGAGYGENLR